MNFKLIAGTSSIMAYVNHVRTLYHKRGIWFFLFHSGNWGSESTHVPANDSHYSRHRMYSWPVHFARAGWGCPSLTNSTNIHLARDTRRCPTSAVCASTIHLSNLQLAEVSACPTRIVGREPYESSGSPIAIRRTGLNLSHQRWWLRIIWLAPWPSSQGRCAVFGRRRLRSSKHWSAVGYLSPTELRGCDNHTIIESRMPATYLSKLHAQDSAEQWLFWSNFVKSRQLSW